MKRKSDPSQPSRAPADLRAEYRFDYGKARPNRFAAQMQDGTLAVVLDPDVASVFQTSESVNSLLRSIILALPENVKREANGDSRDAASQEHAATELPSR